MELNLKGTRLFEETYQAVHDPNIRIIVHQGGTRSSKTYSIAQVYVVMMQEEQGEVFTVVRKTLPALKYSAMRDFLTILKGAEIYSENKHNKTELIYRENGNELEFIAVDQPQKIRGRKRKHLWVNEANELTYEDFQQLIFRTTGKIILDYNPSDEFHWIYDKVLPRSDCKFIKSNYRDNPFLDRETIKEIERLEELDPNYWKIYGLGERGVSQTTIYVHWQFCDLLPENGDEIYGIDFGYNNPVALTKVVIKDNDIHTQEKLYQSHMNDDELIDRMIQMGIPKNAPMYGDSEEPKAIENIRRAGFNIKPANKGKDSVQAGIKEIKKRKFFISKDSVNLLKEVKSYKWREKDGQALDEPVKANDHLMDSIRYAVYTHLASPKPDIYIG